MKKTYIQILSVLIIVAVLGTVFPVIKKSAEIRSETKKWTNKWVDRPAVTSADIQALPVHASRVPLDIGQSLSLTLSKSPWVIDSHVTVQKGVTLTIEPGVEIFVAAKADIQVFGRILALGEQNNRIHLRAYSEIETDSWAGIFIQSDDTSEFKYVDFENSVYGAKLVYASGVWDHCTFKGVREICSGYKSDLSFKTCIFDYRKYAGNGNINVMKFYQGVARIEDSDFFCPDSDYKVDGIDADYMSHAVIRGNRFFGGKCNNSDAIDIGHGSRNIVIEDNLIVGFIDKGVSVGEKAEAFINNNVIAYCGIGVGVKDGAQAIITKTTFYQNGYAVRAYEKVPGHGGGYAEISLSAIAESQTTPVTVDALSTVEISNTLCDSQLLPGRNNGHGTPEFEAVSEYNFNFTNIYAKSWAQTSSSVGTFGAKL